MQAISQKYNDLIRTMMSHTKSGTKVSLEDLYREGNKDTRAYLDTMVEEQLEEGSEIRSFDNLARLASLARDGAKCMLLVEHYSNFDLPVLSYLLRRHGSEGERIADAIVAIAGIKLSETNKVVSAFSEAYSRLVIYPSRSIEDIQTKISDPIKRAAETMKANAINLASMKTLSRLRTSGKIILVFPAGTRYRPWDPSSKRGVREIDSYIRSFDYFCFVSINGNILRLNPEGEMLDDLVCRDKVVIGVSEPKRCDEFRSAAKERTPEGEDKKQAVVDAAMAELDRMHEAVEKSLA